MKIVIFTHPAFLEHKSMPRYASMIGEGMVMRGHEVIYWTAKPVFFKLPAPAGLKKWLSYIDQYLIFPWLTRRRIKHLPDNTLFVFTDHALGPWVTIVDTRPHVVHCHDFLAQHSAMGRIRENHLSWTGKKHQAFIRQGFSRGKHFISVSEKTRTDLHHFLAKVPITSKMVHNGLNPVFKPHDPLAARLSLASRIAIDLADGYLLHVGGNQWYKNRKGLIEIYNQWRSRGNPATPLLLMGNAPDEALLQVHQRSPFQKDIHFVTGVDDELVRLAYAGALMLIFPSYSEGFGWPIAEAMACGCPVLTTDEPTIRAVGAEAAFYIPVCPSAPDRLRSWAQNCAVRIETILAYPESVRMQIVRNGLINSKRFNADLKLSEIEEIYSNILTSYFQ